MLFGALGVPVVIGAVNVVLLVRLTVLFGDGTGKLDDAGRDSVEVLIGAVSEADVDVVMGAVSEAEVDVTFCVGTVPLLLGIGKPEGMGAVPFGAPPTHDPRHAAIQPGAGRSMPLTDERNSHLTPPS